MRPGRMRGAGGKALVGAVGGPQVRVTHGLHGVTGAGGNVGGRAQRGAGIARRRLHEQPLHVGQGHQALVELHVQRHAAGIGQRAALRQCRAKVRLDQPQHGVFEQLLYGRSVMDVRLVDGVALARRPQPVDQPRTEEIALAGALVAPQPDHVDQPVVDPQAPPVAAQQARQVEAFRVAVRRHAHDLELAVQHLETEVLGDGAVQAAERIGLVELGKRVDAPGLAVAEERGRVLAATVDAENRHLPVETGQVIGARRVRQVMLHRHEARAGILETEPAQHGQRPATVAREPPVAGKQCGQGPVRRVPVARGVVPARRRAQADGRVRVGDSVHLVGPDAGLAQAEKRRFGRLTALGVLVANEPLFLGRRHQFAVDQQRGGRVVADRAGQSKDDHRASPASASARSSAASRSASSFQLARRRARSRAKARSNAARRRCRRRASRSSSIN